MYFNDTLQKKWILRYYEEYLFFYRTPPDDLFSKDLLCEQNHWKLWICSHLLKKSLKEIFFCMVNLNYIKYM